MSISSLAFLGKSALSCSEASLRIFFKVFSEPARIALFAAWRVVAREESLAAMKTTTPKSSPLSASTITKDPSSTPVAIESSSIK